MRVVDANKPISLKVQGEYIVSDIIKDIAEMEKLTSRVSKLSLYACDNVSNAIPDDVKASDLLMNRINTINKPLLMKEVIKNASG